MLQAPGAHKWYRATSDYAPGTTDNDVALVEDQIVELLGVSQLVSTSGNKPLLLLRTYLTYIARTLNTLFMPAIILVTVQ